jgi:uncharacterized membrane protein YphA (DoxX/SURF4 family)
MTNQKSSKTLNILLWIAQVILAVMFFMAGVMKTTQPIEKLATQLPWATQIPAALVRFIGISELLGAIGVILPALLRIKPGLTPLAALGFAFVMLFASVFHLFRGEVSNIPMTIILGLIALFVAWGRFRKRPISERDFKTNNHEEAGMAKRADNFI